MIDESGEKKGRRVRIIFISECISSATPVRPFPTPVNVGVSSGVDDESRGDGVVAAAVAVAIDSTASISIRSGGVERKTKNDCNNSRRRRYGITIPAKRCRNQPLTSLIT